MKRKWLLATTLFALAFLVAVWMTGRARERSKRTFGSKTASEWFFGGPDRTQFRSERHMNRAKAAFQVMGTNALPFLFSQLKQRESLINSVYFKVYPALPAFLRTRAPLPVARSDIQFMTLRYLEFLGPLPAECVKQVARCVPQMEDDRVRFNAMFSVVHQMNHPENEPWFGEMLEILLRDSHFLVQLDAAIELSKRTPPFANTLPVLLRGLTNYPLVSQSLWVRGYAYGLPPGSTNPPRLAPFFLRTGSARMPDQATMKQIEVLEALGRLEPRLDAARREQFWLAFAAVPDAKNPGSFTDKIGITPDDVRRKMGNRVREGIRLLSALLKDPAPARRAQAARALAWFGAEAAEAIPALKIALEDSSADVRSAAMGALAKIPGFK